MLYHTTDHAKIPRLGLGTWELRGDDAAYAVAKAIEIGYRHIDTAQAYENEEAVGRGIRDSGVPRDELFVTTKIWTDRIEKEEVVGALAESLDKLQMDQVDLTLLHWPVNDMPIDAQVSQLAACKTSGKSKLIGVSNYNQEQLLTALAATDERLSAIQCEYHPFLDQDPILKTARGFDMLFTSYSPIGRGAKGELMENAGVKRVAEYRGKTPTQVILRWHLQQANVAAIPKSSSEDHLRENFDIFGWDLTATDMKTLYGLIKPDGRMINPDWSPKWDTGVAEAA
ncbi:aldo/keto reductase [Parvularcula dongshanensis]|uniref:Diketogulonate reductase-like aldo/keto reductase n=1 Tax=Parvularcula dongshanensis TaxID=1173995 RepID=A0A840I1Y4_9PROT|nr:aldo/keto reductase [Parvularcula dongshanensis]MBB4659026.1 diketogulonate reductase-like aldo/keto reductase [Parvularcula dongshanensis]